MTLLRNRPLIATIGAVALPMAALLYLANLPGGGRGSLLATLLQVALVLGSVVLFGIFLARFLEQVNATRVRRWLRTDEGREWLADLPPDDRSEFLARLDGRALGTPRPDPPTDHDPADDGPPP